MQDPLSTKLCFHVWLPQVVQNPAATALAAELLLTGSVWPFDAPKQAQLVFARARARPELGPGALRGTGGGAPFRRRRLLQVMSCSRWHAALTACSLAPARYVLRLGALLAAPLFCAALCVFRKSARHAS